MEGKEKEKEEALIKEQVKNDKKKEKAKASNRKQLSTTINKLDKKNLGRIKVKAKKVNKDKLWIIEKITDHKGGKGKKKVSMLLIKWEEDEQTTWEYLSVINETASGMVKDYIKSNKLQLSFSFQYWG